MKKILHLLNTNRFSGAENVVCQIIEMFKSEPEYEMVYCSKDGEIRNVLADKNISYIAISELTVKEVKRVIREVNPDVIHAHDMKASFIASRACGKRELICHIHNNAFDSRGISLKSIAFLAAARKAKRIFWVSKSSFDGYCFKKLLKKKSEILFNILDVDKLYDKANADKKKYDYDVVYIGRLTYPKNPQRLIHVLRKIVDIKSDIKIAIIGTGSLESEIKDLSNSMNLENNVSFLGFCANPLKILQDSKVMIMTSRWEGVPMCALESMALGVPIVSTPVDGMKDLIENGVNGFLSDDNEIIAQNVVRLIQDSELQQTFSQANVLKAREINDINAYKLILKKYYVG